MGLQNSGYMIGQYATAVRISSTAAQAANSRLLEIRNSHATNLIVPTRLRLRALQTAAGTAQENSLDVYRVTGFTVLDTTNTVTPVSSVARSGGGMPAYPGNAAQVRHLTLAGAAAGMTGGTLVKDTQMIGTFPYMVAAAASALSAPAPYDAITEGPMSGIPIILAQNEGIIVENSILNVTTFGVTWYLEFGWCEVSAF
jgi:hypothetical protein